MGGGGLGKGMACAVLAAALWGAGCTSRSHGEGHAELVVFAAASLEEAFEALARDFEAEHGGVEVRLSFAGSQVLRMQIELGARADVFASANETHMRALVDAGFVRDVHIFAHNALVMIVPTGAREPASFAQLPQAERIVLGAANVPAGAYAAEVLARADAELGGDFARAVAERVVSRESNVRLVRAKVELGEADAALVYATDAVGSARVRALPIPDAFEVRARYPMGRVVDGRHPELARAFLAHVRSPRGRRTLQSAGFEAVAP